MVIPQQDMIKQHIHTNPVVSYRISFDGQLLDIISVQVEDSGRFSCEAVNPAGRITKDFSLIVHGMFVCLYVDYSL